MTWAYEPPDHIHGVWWSAAHNYFLYNYNTIYQYKVKAIRKHMTGNQHIQCQGKVIMRSWYSWNWSTSDIKTFVLLFMTLQPGPHWLWGPGHRDRWDWERILQWTLYPSGRWWTIGEERNPSGMWSSQSRGCRGWSLFNASREARLF